MCDSMLWTVRCLQECPEILAIQLAGSSEIEERMMLLLKAGTGAETSRGPLGCWNKLLHRDGTPRISQVSAILSLSVEASVLRCWLCMLMEHVVMAGQGRGACMPRWGQIDSSLIIYSHNLTYTR